MSRKLERLYERSTGCDPRNLIPKPTGAEMQATINKFMEPSKVEGLFNPEPVQEILLSAVLRTGESCGEHYTILGGLTEDHTHLATIVYQRVPEDGHGIEHVISNIPRESWFELDSKNIRIFTTQFAGISRELENM